MKTIFNISVAVVGCLAACVGSEPPIQCTVQNGGFAATYKLVDGTGSCAQKVGETVGMAVFHPAIQGPHGVTQDYDKNTIALQTDTLGYLNGQDPAHVIYSLGDYTTNPDANGVCLASNVSKAEQHVPADATATPPTSAIDISYEWSNVRVLVVPSAPGSEMVADLAYTEGTCTAHYKVVGVWPAVYCMLFDENYQPILDKDGFPTYDETLCSPDPAPDQGERRGPGSTRTSPLSATSRPGSACWWRRRRSSRTDPGSPEVTLIVLGARRPFGRLAPPLCWGSEADAGPGSRRARSGRNGGRMPHVSRR